MILITELDSHGYFAGDYPYQEGTANPLTNWTYSRAPAGMYKAKYTGTRQETGEWVNGEWVDEVENHIGEVVYNTTTKEPKTITEIGPIPAGYTNQVPKEFDYWDEVNGLWETNMQLRNTTLKKRKMVEINNAFETSMLAVRNDYTESEIMSWTKQEVEARRWLKDNTYATPLCDLISEARGMPKTELINKIIIKADQYAYATGLAVGRRQACEDRVMAVQIGQEAQLDQINF